MQASRRLNRRSFLTTVAGSGIAATGGIALVTGTGRAQNIRYTGVTDSDTGEHADRPGYGVGVRNQYTDRDTGPGADAQFHGRGPNGRREGAPSGQGSYGEPPSYCSDSDSGANADPGGRGRNCGGTQASPRNYVPDHTRHCSDSDRGNNADPIQEGRNC